MDLCFKALGWQKYAGLAGGDNSPGRNQPFEKSQNQAEPTDQRKLSTVTVSYLVQSIELTPQTVQSGVA